MNRLAIKEVNGDIYFYRYILTFSTSSLSNVKVYCDDLENSLSKLEKKYKINRSEIDAKPFEPDSVIRDRYNKVRYYISNNKENVLDYLVRYNDYIMTGVVDTVERSVVITDVVKNKDYTSDTKESYLSKYASEIKALRKAVLDNPVKYRGASLKADDKTISALINYISINNSFAGIASDVKYDYKFLDNKYIENLDINMAKDIVSKLFKYQQACREAESATYRELESLSLEDLKAYQERDFMTDMSNGKNIKDLYFSKVKTNLLNYGLTSEDLAKE